MKAFLIFAWIAICGAMPHAGAFSLHCDLSFSITDGESSDQKRIIFDLTYPKNLPITTGHLYTSTCFGKRVDAVSSTTSVFSTQIQGDFVYGKFGDQSMTIGSHHLAMLLNLIYSGKDPRNQNPIYFSAEGAIRALDDPTFIFDHAAGQCILDQT